MLLGLALAGALDHLLHGHILELGPLPDNGRKEKSQWTVEGNSLHQWNQESDLEVMDCQWSHSILPILLHCKLICF